MLENKIEQAKQSERLNEIVIKHSLILYEDANIIKLDEISKIDNNKSY